MKKRRLTTLKDWLIIVASLADDAAVLGILLLVMSLFGFLITLPLVVFLLFLVGGYALLIHRFVVPALHRRKSTGAEGMIGEEGIVVQTLKPAGMIKVHGEYWGARSPGGEIPVHTAVEITGISELILEVKRKSG